jgi:ADP-heptose:LPS heptosyltransferase
MRILISNPDNIGDVVLRQPMFAALTAAGHELSIVVRSFVAPIAPLVASDASLISFESNPYSPDFDPDSFDIRRVLDAARSFAPDVFCIAPYQRTPFDELLAESLESCITVGMNGVLYAGYINAGVNYQSKITLDRTVSVAIHQHELEKNELLCGELLGTPVRLPDPGIQADCRHLDEARAVVTRLGMNPGEFWVASVGENPTTAVKNWGLEQWSQVLSHAVNRHRRQVLLIGTPDEHEASEQVRMRMGLAGDRVANLCDSPPPLAVTVGLMQLSAGYIGRDTGPMHISAALGKPVVAVFGGGHWPRFTPRPKVGFVASVIMPCAGCNWICHLHEPYCVRRVPAENVIRAFDAIQAGNISGLQIQPLPLEPMLSARSIRESADMCHDLMRRSAAAERQLRELHDDLSRQTATLQASESQAAKNAGALAGAQAEFEAVRSELEASRAKVSELTGKLSETTDDLARTQSGLRDAAEQLTQATASRNDLESELRTERSKAELLQIETAQTRNQAETEKKSLTDELNDLLARHGRLSQDAEQWRRELGEYEKSLQQSEESRRVTERALQASDESRRVYEEALQASEQALREHRQSISFRVLIMAGRPVVAVGRRLRGLLSRG